ncbi:MAG TPA: MmgE/PrpD family protein [Candidatus Binatia bacterium]|nr:MmgE/PrpD family protein [Candidatus Binatia bacterium]
MKVPRKNVTTRIADFVAATRFEDIPAAVLETAKAHILDGIATMIAGAREEASLRIRRYVIGLGGAREATIVGTRIKIAARYAALANGVQGHVLDYDDTQLATSAKIPFGQLTHPTTPVLAAALALAEKFSARGGDLLAAYIVGVEVACRLADAIDPRHYLDGFHSTGTIGVFGAAAASARLAALDAKRTESALGLAATFSAGVRANRGSMAKALNAGRAAENGVVAAELARLGFTAAENIFEAPMGFFSAASRNNVDGSRLRFGKPFFFGAPGIAVKRYPCAGVLHSALDAAIDLAVRHDIDARSIEKITLTMGKLSAAPLVYDRPATGMEGKFSAPFSVAVALLDRAAGLRQYVDAKVSEGAVQALMRKVELVRDARLDAAGVEHALARLEIRLRRGRSYRAASHPPKGHPKNPLSPHELEDKFRECAGAHLDGPSIQRMIDTIRSIENVRSISSMMADFRRASAKIK